MGDLVIQMGEMVGRRRRKEGGPGADRLMLDIMGEVEEKRVRSRRASEEEGERLRRVSGSVKGPPEVVGWNGNGMKSPEEEEAERGDGLGELGKSRVEAVSPTRQRKVSHRKVIIHDDGEICNSTYNKVCPYGHEDPLLSNPPMFHESGGELPQGLLAAMQGMGGMGGFGGMGGMGGLGAMMGGMGGLGAMMGGMGGEGMNPEILMRMASMGGGGGEGMNPEMLRMMASMGGGGGGGEGFMGALGAMGAMGAMGGGGGVDGGMNPELMMRLAMASAGGGRGGGMEGLLAAMAGNGGLLPLSLPPFPGEGGEQGGEQVRQYMQMMQAMGMGMGMGGSSSRHSPLPPLLSTLVQGFWAVHGLW